MQPYTDYLMVISLPENLAREINRYKMASVNLVGHFEGMYSRPHIIVTHQTRCKPFFLEPTILKIGKKLSTVNPIELQVNGFSFFTHGQTARTIYAEIENTSHTAKWFRLLQTEIGIKIKNFVPHVTIARNIPVTAFNKLWPNFDSREFSYTFKATGLTILHRETYVEHNDWKLYRELFFANKEAIF